MIQQIGSGVRRRARGDDGVGLILVIGVSVFVFLLAAVAVAIAVNGVSQSRQRTAFEKALATAESGVDFGLGKLQASFTVYGADYPIPAMTTALDSALGNSPACQAPVVNFPSSGDGAGGIFASEATERAWATTQLQLLATIYPACIRTGDAGQYVILKPPSDPSNTDPGRLKYGRVYALSAMPSFAQPTRTRLVKSEYVFMPYRPSNAILSGGDLDISSSTTVTVAAGADPLLASVHANGTITGSGNPSVSGSVSSTLPSTFSSNNFAVSTSVTRTPKQIIPTISAVSFYSQASTVDPNALADWYDLCPNGDVRPYSTGGPCTSPILVDNIAFGGQSRGWQYQMSSHTWTATTSLMSGTYYVSEGNVVVGPGNVSIPRLTVIASAANVQNCSTKTYGNITWDHYALQAPAFGGQWMYADTDLVTGSNFTAGDLTVPISGMFVAGDQVQLETSSTGAVGAVVAANQCLTPPSAGLITTSQVKNPAIYYDPNAQAAFTSVVTTSLWLDYSGG